MADIVIGIASSHTAFACFTGDELVDMPPGGEALERMPKGIRAASWAAHSDHEQTHPVRADLSAHVAEQLARDDFDITVLRQQPAARCYRFGRALCRGLQSWETTARVAIIASGGLSHFVVDEDLDRLVLSGITGHDAGVLGSLTREQMRSGTSEILNWIVAAGALENLSATVLDYVPGYRTPAGTGTGMAFARWD